MMLPAMKAIAAMRASGLKPSVVEMHLTGQSQCPFWRYGDGIAEVSLPITPDVARMDFRPVVGCIVILYAATRTETLRRVVLRLIEVVSILTVVVLNEIPENLGHEWQKGKGWREVAGGTK